ncbi:YybH family protein [Solimonas soli]|uniref:YybH family protein n=1 Tax=Solimonas soli TaxID=413479 RepID=UPI00048218BC|nr:nuclear transport factor 2 family protein [Solimonas soli]
MSIEAPDEIRRIIKERSDLFEKNFAAGDAAAIVRDYYVPDALAPTVSEGSGPTVVGHAALTSLFEAFCKDFAKARQVPRYIRADRDLAYEVSNSYLTPKAGGDEVEFRYVAVWRRCADTWRVETDFFALGKLV